LHPDKNGPATVGRPVVAAIGGSDPSGGAGIQADLKTIHALGGYAVTLITSVTAQTTGSVRAVEHLPAAIVRSQMEAIASDFDLSAVKTGMLGTGEIVETIVDLLSGLPAAEVRGRTGIECTRPLLVVDPVLAATGGHPLLDAAGIDALRRRLLPLATVCTPNWEEAGVLSGIDVRSAGAAERAAAALLEAGARAVVVTGGHAPGDECVDLLVTRSGSRAFASPRLPLHPHGTGCAFAAALATALAAGSPLESAVERAKAYVTRAIRSALPIARERPILDHSGAAPCDERAERGDRAGCQGREVEGGQA